jgi:DNA-directed RNA polymerase subunit RPC12/RpoP
MVAHSNIRDFECDICGTSFKTKSSLDDHKATHNSESPYTCSLCESKFKTKKNLQRHVKWHTAERKHECTQCGIKYMTKSHLLRHVDANHKEEGIRIRKKKEHEIAEYLLSKDIPFVREDSIDFKCVFENDTYCRIDFKIVYDGTIFLLEIDEFQHDWYSQYCETRRMYSVFQSLTVEGNNLPIVFIRYNPDRYKVDSELVKTPKSIRMHELVEFIQTFKPSNQFNIKYMFYNVDNSVLKVLNDSEYNEEVKQFVL